MSKYGPFLRRLPTHLFTDSPTLLQFNAHLAHQEFHVFPRILLGTGVAQQERRVIRAHDFRSAAVMHLSAQLADRHRRAEQVLRRHGTQAANEFRANQVRVAAPDTRGNWTARRAADCDFRAAGT